MAPLRHLREALQDGGRRRRAGGGGLAVPRRTDSTSTPIVLRRCEPYSVSITQLLSHCCAFLTSCVACMRFPHCCHCCFDKFGLLLWTSRDGGRFRMCSRPSPGTAASLACSWCLGRWGLIAAPALPISRGSAAPGGSISNSLGLEYHNFEYN